MTTRRRGRRPLQLDATLTLRLRGDWRDALDDAAEDLDVSVADLHRRIVRDWLVASGRIPAPAPPRGSVLHGSTA
jgi:hypothetical protein